jgi:hypothetical protein
VDFRQTSPEEAMRTYLELAPAPTEEDCAQVGTPGYRDRALVECARFIRLLRRNIGPAPEGAWLSVKWFDHDFDPYCEVVCYYHTAIPASVEYAYRCEANLPAAWDE